MRRSRPRVRSDRRRWTRPFVPAVRVALDNERLRREIATRVGELERSRTRIVEASAVERHRLERNVHDGVQQYLVALLAELGLARAAGDASAARAADEVRRTLEKLRALTQGIATPVLDVNGLGPALAALADRTDAELVVEGGPGIADDGTGITGRAALDVYGIVAIAAATADRLRLPTLHVTLRRGEDAMVLRIVPAAAHEPALDARVAAVGGTVNRAGGGWEVVLPCR